MPLYSHSRLSTFESCPRQFHFRYVLKIPEETEGIEAFVGKRVHEVLERLHEFVDRGQVPPLQKVVDRYLQLFEEQSDPERVRIVKPDMDVADYRELGTRCLHNYYRRHYPFDVGETLGLEERVVFSLDEDGRYKMQGIVDRISRGPDGVIEIIDYKTGQWVPSQQQLDTDRQLALYQLGLQDVYGPKQPMRLVWHYLARGVTRVSQRTAEQLEALRTATIDRIDEIQRESAYEPKTSRLCDWCQYRSICPAFQEAGAQPQDTPVAAPASGAAASRAPSARATAKAKAGANGDAARPRPLANRDGQLNLL